MIPYSVKAEYREQIIPEYRGNPLIEALPDIWSTDEVIERLSESAEYHDGERMLDAQYRLHCIQRIFRYFQPLEQHIDIEQRLSRCIRQGYLGRNPMGAEYAGVLSSGYDTMKDRSGYGAMRGVRSNASGFTIIGISGVGKSTAMDRVLSLYPQRIVHSRYHNQALPLTQLVWLKIDCPHDGSLKGLCFQFFHEMDRTMGTNYFHLYSRARNTIDTMLVVMAQIVSLYQIGVLVIDEIQHLSQAKGGGSEKMLNFFVTLVNTIGIPVILIGTTKAMSVLQSEFRQARRGSGQGDLLWDRMKNDASWRVFLKSMWRFQWTQKRIPFTEKMSDAIYDESQGIIDIAVKLYAMAQIKAISNGTETFSMKDIHDAALEKLGLVQPMLNALRSGDARRIMKYEDIAPISIEDYLAICQPPSRGEVSVKSPSQKISLSEQTIIRLMELGVEPSDAKRLAGRVIASHKNPIAVNVAVKEAYRLYIEDERESQSSDTNEDSALLGAEGYENVKQRGIIDESEW